MTNTEFTLTSHNILYPSKVFMWSHLLSWGKLHIYSSLTGTAGVKNDNICSVVGFGRGVDRSDKKVMKHKEYNENSSIF